MAVLFQFFFPIGWHIIYLNFFTPFDSRTPSIYRVAHVRKIRRNEISSSVISHRWPPGKLSYLKYINSTSFHNHEQLISLSLIAMHNFRFGLHSIGFLLLLFFYLFRGAFLVLNARDNILFIVDILLHSFSEVIWRKWKQFSSLSFEQFLSERKPYFIHNFWSNFIRMIRICLSKCFDSCLAHAIECTIFRSILTLCLFEMTINCKMYSHMLIAYKAVGLCDDSVKISNGM